MPFVKTYQVTGPYGRSDEDLYECCPRCGEPLRRPVLPGTHTPEDCERIRQQWAVRQACDDRDEGRAPSLATVLLAYVEPALLPWVRL
jgi:hypothetical protein